MSLRPKRAQYMTLRHFSPISLATATPFRPSCSRLASYGRKTRSAHPPTCPALSLRHARTYGSCTPAVRRDRTVPPLPSVVHSTPQRPAPSTSKCDGRPSAPLHARPLLCAAIRAKPKTRRLACSHGPTHVQNHKKTLVARPIRPRYAHRSPGALLDTPAPSTLLTRARAALAPLRWVGPPAHNTVDVGNFDFVHGRGTGSSALNGGLSGSVRACPQGRVAI